MAMDFKRRLPIPMEIREEMPLSAELTAKKQAFDAEVAKVFTGEDARKVVIGDVLKRLVKQERPQRLLI